MKETIQQWFLMLTTREKVIIVAGGFFTVTMLLWGMVYEPLKNHQSKFGDKITERTNELRWMQASSQQIKQAKNNPKTTKPVSKGTPSSIISQQLRRFGLQTRAKMSGRKQVSLRLKAVQADALMKLLGILEMRYSIYVLSLEITPKGTAGKIDATIKLGRQP
jgi:type II secretory pathway component PulM